MGYSYESQGHVLRRTPGDANQHCEGVPDQPVVLRGDENVNYRYVVDALDICRAANIWNVAFATSKPE